MDRRRFLHRTCVLVAAAYTVPLIGQTRTVRDPFTLGVASGEPAADGFALWTRLAPDPLVGGGLREIWGKCGRRPMRAWAFRRLRPDAATFDRIAPGRDRYSCLRATTGSIRIAPGGKPAAQQAGGDQHGGNDQLGERIRRGDLHARDGDLHYRRCARWDLCHPWSLKMRAGISALSNEVTIVVL